ncbi:hypothetical protein Leryth_020060 [Lithospermum erythrorhizon]|nr:hypothetical protein Leryth_020060 [Lithospermum erythrorhizon]
MIVPRNSGSQSWLLFIDSNSFLTHSNKTMDPSRITLRPFTTSDVDDFLKWASDHEVTKFLRWNTITTKHEAFKYIQEVAIPHPWRRSICLDDCSIGYISIKPESGNDRHRAHVGYALGRQYWGKGIVTLALMMSIPMAFQEFPYLVRIEALVEEENKGSQRVLEKAGFTREGLLRKYGFNKGEIKEMLIYSFLSNDPLIK